MGHDGLRWAAILLAVGASAWAGGLVTVILAVVSSRSMDAGERIALFRTFGRRFATFFGVTGILVIVSATTLAATTPTPMTVSTLVLAILLLVGTAGGILQARRMTALRTALTSEDPGTDTVRRNALVATVIRSVLVLGYVALLVLAVMLASTV